MSRSSPSFLPSSTPPGTYPRAVIFADSCRAALGLILTLGPFFWVTPHLFIAIPLVLAALVFLAFSGRTWIRWHHRFECDEQGIQSTGPFAVALRWDDVTEVRLRFYSLRRRQSAAAAASAPAEAGWMELSIRGPGGRLGGRRFVLESTLVGFETIIAGVAAAARANGLDLDEATRENLLHFGEHVPRPRR